MKNTSKENLVGIINAANSFLILTHKHPDGDAISSSLAMFWYLLDIGKEETTIDVVIPEYAKELSFISGIQNLKEKPSKVKYDLAILVDCAELWLLNSEEYLRLVNKTICIDHHEKSVFYADYNMVDINTSSCTSIIYETFVCNNLNYLDCIATGVISDTSNLTLNVTPKTRNLLESLKQAGVDIDGISKKLTVKNSRTEELAQLVIKRGKFIGDTIFCSYLLQNDLLETEKNLTQVNHKLIVQEIQKVVDFESLILLIEKESGEFKGSLRTFSPDVNLITICSNLLEKGEILKGGGHSYSAGCTAVGSYEKLFDIISKEILGIKNQLH